MQTKYATKVATLSLLSLMVGVSLFRPAKALAFDIPSFPHCETPQGTTISNDGVGTHGIAGSYVDHVGTDVVYSLSDTTVMQCFCGNDNTGIQTNWLDVKNVNDQDLDYLRRSGWIYIPDGSLWGLKNEPYMTYNSNYSCVGQGGGGGSSNNGGSGSNSSNGSSNGSSSQGSSSPAGVGGIVLGLANTGAAPENALILLAILFLVTGCFLLTRSRTSN